ncbi:AraC family transcriptional regulator [Cohnella sp. WQ 127256]|uniref:AraC family transcriptional regulator n=1 Tax=Cohnella sp. WQ 127256 TaxID=2938790 RepID=UPI0021180622|nr:AraC family transcriptional regulator [Cohnella sp. WQ 127256]
MTYSKDLWENTLLSDRQFPINMFCNRVPHARKEQNVLFLHWHEHFEVIYMQEGHALFYIDSLPYEASPGDVLFVPSGGLHVGYSLADCPVQYMSIVFNTSLLEDSAIDPAYQRYIKPFMVSKVSSPVKLSQTDENSAKVQSLLQQMIEEFTTKDAAYQLAIKTHMLLLFIHIARLSLPNDATGTSSEPPSRNLEPFKQLIRYLESHYSDKLSIEQAAKYVNLSSFHFCKTFKKITGRTFIEYVNLYRMNEADRLLLESTLSVTEIAERIGCDNPNYFTKLFKRYKGMTPSQWRKM